MTHRKPRLPYDAQYERQQAQGAFGEKFRRGGQKGRRMGLGKTIRDMLVRDPRIDVNAIFDRLPGARKTRRDAGGRQIDATCRRLRCREEYHIHWVTDTGTPRSLGFKGLREKVSRIRGSFRPPTK
jgi:hypothetical protein